MQAKPLALSLLLAALATGPAMAWDRGGDRPGDDRRRGGPNIVIEPEIDLSRRSRPNTDDPDFIMAEIGRCHAAGIQSFVDCLRPNHGAIMIRRLEACVRSETIPDDRQRVALCIPLTPQP
ncbi:MAG: hypothetical protein AB7S70_17480 [Hyphomicrobium sp.]